MESKTVEMITLLIVTTDTEERVIKISKNAKVCDVIKQYRKIEKIPFTRKINLYLESDSKTILDPSKSLKDVGITQEEESLIVQFEENPKKPDDIPKRTIHFYIMDREDKHSRYAYCDHTLEEHLKMYRENFKIAENKDKPMKLYFEEDLDTELNLKETFLKLFIESERVLVVKY